VQGKRPTIILRNWYENIKELHNIELNDTYNAFLWLKSLRYSTGKIGIYGVSRGAEQTLLLTSVLKYSNLAN
jgi:predicted acyl esterase